MLLRPGRGHQADRPESVGLAVTKATYPGAAVGSREDGNEASVRVSAGSVALRECSNRAGELVGPLIEAGLDVTLDPLPI